MLIKKICRKCHNKSINKLKDEECLKQKFETIWDYGYCICYIKEKFQDNIFCETIKVDGEPPKECPYTLEQLVHKK